jgi:hypothetical protein
MPRRTAVVVAALGLAALVPAGAAAAAKKGERSIVIKARSQLENVKIVDSAPSGDSAGDLLVFTEKLFNSRGKQIGSDAATCTRLFDQTSLCTGLYRLHGGQVMVQLLQPGPTGTYDQAVTGGTGRFESARGIVRVAQHPGSGDRFTFKLRVPRR